MATGIKNLSQKETLPSGTIVCWYGGRKSNAAANPPNNRVTYAYLSDYMSYSSNVFTVKKAFNGIVQLSGGGARTGDPGTTGSHPTTVKLYINDTTKISATITYTGSGTPDAINYSFKVGDTIRVTEYHNINSYYANVYFFISTQ